MAVAAKRKRLGYRMFFWCRIFVSLGILLLFLRTFTSSRQMWSDLRADLTAAQFTGALMSGGVTSLVVLGILLISLLLGRWYCSFLCPFGTLQLLAWKSGGLLKLAAKGRYAPPSRLRYFLPALAGVGLIFSLWPLFVVMDPLSNFGRGVRGLYALVAGQPVGPFFLGALGMFGAVLGFAFFQGRRFCDWCPLGTLLGLCARTAPLGMTLRPDLCVGCGNCEALCPMRCIDASNKTLDRERCVLCLNCAAHCAMGALDYGCAGSLSPSKRRAFFQIFHDRAAFFAGASGLLYLGGATFRALRSSGAGAAAEPASGEAGLAEPEFMENVMPPGAGNREDFLSRCIRCGACVAACPSGIVRIDRTSWPELDYSRGYCQYNCRECSNACPAHALRPFHDAEEKRRTRIALSDLHRKNCVVITRRESCGACAEVCPTHALRMEPLKDGSNLTAPVFDPLYCIGCGGCLQVCPALPKAFAVRGVAVQVRTPGMRPGEDDDEGLPSLPASGDDFPF
ncbi:MAG: 4Fe-4S binding protein [Synergistaceae bacterium]|jgi:ferredoxin|nr:4Fe-4S binding protein [Synergistaceae bacterium]